MPAALQNYSERFQGFDRRMRIKYILMLALPLLTAIVLQVFIPDEEVAARKKQEPFEDWRVGSNPSATAAPDRAQSRAAAITSAPAAFSAGAGAAQQQSPAQVVPNWWDPPPVLHSSGAFKEEVMPRQPICPIVFQTLACLMKRGN